MAYQILNAENNVCGASRPPLWAQRAIWRAARAKKFFFAPILPRKIAKGARGRETKNRLATAKRKVLYNWIKNFQKQHTNNKQQKNFTNQHSKCCKNFPIPFIKMANYKKVYTTQKAGNTSSNHTAKNHAR